MSKPPVVIPLGAMRFNSDSQKLEYFNGDTWFQIHTFNPDLNGGARGFTAGGSPGPYSNVIDWYTIPTQGNASDFGDLTQARNSAGGCASRTRGVLAGGHNGSRVNTIDYWTHSAQGNATDFGNLLSDKALNNGMCSNQTRGVSMGTDPSSDVCQYITIASTGNAVDFGNTYNGNQAGGAAAATPSRGFLHGGGVPAKLNIIQYVTIATLGDTQDFGDLPIKVREFGACSNSTRSVTYAGDDGSNIKTITKTELVSKGNGILFGDCNTTHTGGVAVSSPIRGIVSGGSPGTINTMEYTSLSTSGDAVDFGDLTNTNTNYTSGTSNAHGGLG